MSEMIHYIITNEIVLMEQYANDKSLGLRVRGLHQSPPWSRNISSFWIFNESHKFACFL